MRVSVEHQMTEIDCFVDEVLQPPRRLSPTHSLVSYNLGTSAIVALPRDFSSCWSGSVFSRRASTSKEEKTRTLVQ